MATRGVARRVRSSSRRADMSSLIVAAVSVAAAFLLGPAEVEAQGRPQLGAFVSAGRVTYVAAHVASPASWTLSLSARRARRDGRWDSATVDIARRVWATSGGRAEIRVIGRHDRLKGPHGAAVAAEASWKATRRLVVAGNTALSLHESSADPRNVRFRTAVAGARLRLVEGLALASTATVDARGSVRLDLFLYGVR